MTARTCAIYCAPSRRNPATDADHYCEARDLNAGGGWAVGLTWTRGEGCTLQLVNDDAIGDHIDGIIGLADGLRLAFAIVRQVARAQTGRILRKWTSRPRHGHATPLSHSAPPRLGSR